MRMLDDHHKDGKYADPCEQLYKETASVSTPTVLQNKTLGCSTGWEGRRCCRRPQNQQTCLWQNADFFKTVPKTTDLIFAGAIDL